jgi:nitroreductase
MPTIQQSVERPLTALDTIFTRRSVRAYTRQAVDAATIRALLDAAVQAPTAMHEEPWAFVVVQDAATLKRLSDRAKGTLVHAAAHYRGLQAAGDPEMRRAFLDRLADPDFSIFYDATTLIVICAKPKGPFVVADCWLAAENLMLAAAALGLGTCCIGSALPMLNSPETKAELGIPRTIEAVAPIVVGVPRESAAADAGRREPDVLSWIRHH